MAVAACGLDAHIVDSNPPTYSGCYVFCKDQIVQRYSRDAMSLAECKARHHKRGCAAVPVYE